MFHLEDEGDILVRVVAVENLKAAALALVPEKKKDIEGMLPTKYIYLKLKVSSALVSEINKKNTPT